MVDSLWICTDCYHRSNLVLGNKVQLRNTQILTVERTIARGKIIGGKDLQARIRRSSVQRNERQLKTRQGRTLVNLNGRKQSI